MSLVAVLPVKRFPSAKARLANDGLSSAQRLALAVESVDVSVPLRTYGYRLRRAHPALKRM